jgi:HK97 gp10 family phage protein
MKVTAQISGFTAAIKSMKELADKIERGGMRESLTKAARPMTARVKSLAPAKRAGKAATADSPGVNPSTGMLKKSIRQKLYTNKQKHLVTIYIGPSRNVEMWVDRFGDGNITPVRPANYAHLVEFGTASRGSYGRKGEKVSGGNPARPFLRPGYAQTKVATHQAYAKLLGEAIDKSAAKQARLKAKRR